MAGTGVGKFSSTAGNNTSNMTTNFAENMAPSNVNNAARELMGHIYDMYKQLGDGYFEFGDGDATYTVARSDADTITITSSSDISSIYFPGRKIRITDGGANVVEGTIASSSHSSTTQTVNLTGISLASGTPTKVELGIDTAAFGGRIILDDDGDSYIEAPTDDTIDFYAGGTKIGTFTATTVTFNDGVEITTADNTDTLTLTSTDADASVGPNLRLYRNSSSPEDGNQLAKIDFEGRNDNSQDVSYFDITAYTRDVSDGEEDGILLINGIKAGSSVEYIRIDPHSSHNGIVFNDGSTDMDFRVESNGNANTLFVNGGTDRVGVGTNAPAQTMHIRSTGNPSNDTGLILEGGATDSNCALYFYNSAGTEKGRFLYDTDDNILSTKVNSSEVMRIDSSGNVGIGNTTMSSFTYAATTRLVVGDGSGDEGMTIYSGTASASNIAFADGTSGNARGEGIVSYNHADNAMRFFTSATEKMRIDSSGRVGIGTSSPTDMLDISGTNPNIAFIETDQSNKTYKIGSFGAAYAVYDSTAGAFRFTITTDGHVRINTTTSEETAKFCVGTTQVVSELRNTNASFGSDNSVESIACKRSSNSSYRLLRGVSGNGSSTLFADNEFIFQGNGDLSVDGSVGTGGADYAEMFEWKDGNASSEDRRGYSVVLDGNKIVKATDSDDTSKIIGIVSAMPVVIGDSDIDDKWRFKYLKDDFGNYVMEDYTVTEWTEVVEDGDDIEHSYATDRIPDDITAPSDATVIVTEKDGAGNTINLQRKKLNPDWDNSKTYVRRKNRKEWDAIGLMGKLRILKGQPTGTNWIKMRDISDTIEEWLVR